MGILIILKKELLAFSINAKKILEKIKTSILL